MNWNLAISGVPSNPANFLVAALYDGGVLAFHQTVPKPGGGYTGATITITFAGVDAIVYEFKLWESVDASPAGTVLSDFSLQPSANTAQIRPDTFRKPGITAGCAVGGDTIVDASLVGWTYRVEKIGYDTFEPGVDYAQDSGGGWHLLGGQKFAAGDVYVEQYQPLIVIANNAPNLIKSSAILTAATVMDASYVGKATILQSAGTTLPITLPTLASVTDNQVIMIYSMGGLHKNSVISCAGTDKIQWVSGLTSKLILGQGEVLELFKFSGAWWVKNVSSGVLQVGEFIYKQTKGDVNTVFADGSLLDRGIYARLFDYLLTNGTLPVVSEVNWVAQTEKDLVEFPTNKGCWTMGTDGTNFRVPYLLSGNGFGTGFLRAVDGVTRAAGSLQIDAQEDLRYPTLTGKFPGQPNGKGPVQLGGGYDNEFNQSVDLTGSGGILDGGGNFVASQKLSYENRPSNIGMFISIRA